MMRLTVAAMVLSVCASAQAQQWSATTVQAVPGHEPFYAMTSVDVPTPRLTVWAEHYGVPWDAFASNGAPPEPWRQMMLTIAFGARVTGKPVDLQLLLTRDAPARHATSAGLVAMPRCADLTAYRTAYARYVTWMVRTFRPATVNVAVEISRFVTGCGTGPAWDAAVQVANAGAAAAKAARRVATVYVSVQLEDLYGQSLIGFDEGLYAALSGLTRERFGVSTYPQALAGDVVAALPADYLTRVRARHPEERPVWVAETGWLSTPLVLGSPGACWPALNGSPETQAQYRAWLASQGVELVTWWSSRDLIPHATMTACVPATCLADDSWCQAVNVFRAVFGQPAGDLLFKAFGTMGLSGYGGEPK